jgi:hypothetical protein
MPADDTSTERLLSSGVTESNIMAFLGHIERRVTEIVHLVNASKAGHSLTTVPSPSALARLHKSSVDQLRAHTIKSATTVRSTGMDVGDRGGVGAALGSRADSQLPVALADIDDSDSEGEGARVYMFLPLRAASPLDVCVCGRCCSFCACHCVLYCKRQRRCYCCVSMCVCPCVLCVNASAPSAVGAFERPYSMSELKSLTATIVAKKKVRIHPRCCCCCEPRCCRCCHGAVPARMALPRPLAGENYRLVAREGWQYDVIVILCIHSIQHFSHDLKALLHDVHELCLANFAVQVPIKLLDHRLAQHTHAHTHSRSSTLATSSWGCIETRARRTTHTRSSSSPKFSPSSRDMRRRF